MSNNQLTVCNVAIRQDAEGRYYLNDLHKASGNNPKDKPNEWLSNKGTQDLIAEIIAQENPASEKINNLAPVKTVNSFTEQQGTYVVKPLVYAYAMWISPAFHLHVITSYDTMMSGYIPEHIIKAYEIIVENLPYVKPITDTISLTEYQARKSALLQGLHDLNSVKIVLTGEELEAFRK